METSEHIEQCFTDIRDYIEELKGTIGSLGHLNRTISSTAQKGIRELESRLAQVERERDAALAEWKRTKMDSEAMCWTCKHGLILDAGTCRCTSPDPCDEGEEWQWRGVCAENTKEEST